ncbi:MAG: isochorismatase family protein [Tepidisphaeraceae bacterium]
MSDSISLDVPTTALVLIDLQRGIVGRPLAPHAAADVVSHAVRLADAVRAGGGLVVLVNVDVTQVLPLPVDQPMRPPGSPPPPTDACELMPELGRHPGDVLITKRQWGAFYGTGLDQQLRRRQIRTIILGGVATNFGVESTARAAFDRGYHLIFAEDAMSTVSADAHGLAMTHVFPRMGRVRSTQAIVDAISGSASGGRAPR